MIGSGQGNSAFDVTFFVIEGIALILALIVVFLSKHLPGWSVIPTLIVSGALTILTPIYWYMVFPPLGGLDGAGRLLFGVPVVLLNLVAIAIGVYRAALR